MKNVNSINELIKKFEDIIVDEENLITNESVVALKHVVTGKYLSSNKDLNYTTGSKFQLVFAIMERMNIMEVFIIHSITITNHRQLITQK
ncbi:unnamed protein product [Rhizophagus irregularis]|uniref:Uncharacterized protein n=1 Tax=Rhizophagus irregularis TaxID=588596 RepID=A0A915YZ47_9GLOM|nr:unnamed protein product [Rhizophagus irregularis]CAB5355698.1 unnamed protein product [Rhizophagus irregularis]